ncbi:hypothetical protein FTO74_14340 [Granulicella sp. WH15]|uniref:hypothetical protein n=1 Tax=Granulicella sp. WH15 TaxID=2602070 RepID=UPI0013675436|nr:hypothetical protein [Granulicella sp. WH15]QHN04411.1 hypothetical protein FTO74_14340 [Granulicella sp. WH15]
MRIIREGIQAAQQVVRFDCSRCHAMFEATAKEVTFVADFRDGDYLSIACPTCKDTCTRAAPQGFVSW